MPPSTKGTYRQNFFSQVTIFLQQFINIISDDLKKKTKHTKYKKSDITLILVSDDIIFYCCKSNPS